MYRGDPGPCSVGTTGVSVSAGTVQDPSTSGPTGWCLPSRATDRDPYSSSDLVVPVGFYRYLPSWSESDPVRQTGPDVEADTEFPEPSVLE